MVSLLTEGLKVLEVLTCGAIVSLLLNDAVLKELIFTDVDGCVDLELSLVQAVKHPATAKANKVILVSFFTFVLFIVYYSGN